MIRRIFLLLILISLCSISFVSASDIDNTTLDSSLFHDEAPELTASVESQDLLSISQNDSAALESSSQKSDVSSKDGDSSAYLILDNDADKENVHIGEYVTWIVSVINTGPGIAKNLKVLDQIPDGLKYIKHTTTKGTFDPKTGIWDIGDLSVEDNEVFLYITTLAVSVGEKINKANLTCDTVNLNNHTYEEEEIDVVENSKDSNEVIYENTLKSTGNPLMLVILSLLGCFIGYFKRS